MFAPLAQATPEQRAAAHVALVWDFRWHGLADLLRGSPKLQWVHAGSAGVDHLLPALAGRADIVLTNSAGVFERPIAEYVLGLMLAHAKGFVETAQAQAARRWAYRETASLDGATLVIIGAGRIGTAIAELAAAVGMRVIGVRRTAPSSAPPPPSRNGALLVPAGSRYMRSSAQAHTFATRRNLLTSWSMPAEPAPITNVEPHAFAPSGHDSCDA